MPKRKLESSKRHRSAFFKYSNQVLFERREKEFIKNKQEKNDHKTIYLNTSRNHYKNLKQKFFKEKNIFQYLKTLQYINSNNQNKNNDFFQTISFSDEFKKKIQKNKKFHKSYSNVKYNIFNLTETNKQNSRKILYNNNSAKYYHTFNYNRNNNDGQIKNIRHINDYNYKGINELILIKNKNNLENLKNNECQKKIEKIKDIKIWQINRTKEGFRDFIEKTRNYNIISYSTKVKNERAIRLGEIYKNKIDFYNNTNNSLIKYKNLCDALFLGKMTEYLKFLSINIRQEKYENSKLITKIRNYKNEIEIINAKIKRVEYEKSNIVRWLYLQIQLKEKKIILPNYYKSIFEFNKNVNININKIKNNKKIFRKQQSLNQNDIKAENKKIKKKLSIFKNLFNKEINNDNKNNNNNENNTIELNGVKIKIEEYERIKQYKNKLIFTSPELFNDALLNIENNNLKLINYYDKLRNQLIFLKNEFIKVKNEKKNIDNYINSKIKYNEKVLNGIKSEINLNAEFGTDLEGKKKDKKSILFIKILKIYENCRVDDNDINNTNDNIIKLPIEEEIINMLKYIEIKVNELINKINLFIKKENKISSKDFIKKIKIEIEKDHKIEKAEIQKFKQKEKYKKLYEKIQERNNKIYFLPKKKIDISKFKSKKSEKNEIRTEPNEDKKIEDFLFE